MFIKCSWHNKRGKLMGIKRPLLDFSMTSGICDKCLHKNFPHEAEKIDRIIRSEKC